MRRLGTPCVLVCVLFLFFGAHPSHAQWVYNGIVVSGETDYQMNSEIVSDGGDGAIIVWEDWRGSSIDIYAQRVDPWGYTQWTTNGAPVCTDTGVQMLPQMCADGAGGAIIVFIDTAGPSWDLYAQRIDADGATVWATPAVVTTADTTQENHRICPDGAGGAVIVWEDYQYGTADIFAQRIDQTGAAVWESPVAVCTNLGEQTRPQVIQDGAGGFIIVWKDTRTMFQGIYAQKLLGDGTKMWGTTGTACCTVPESGLGWPQLVSDGAYGAYVTWHDERNSTDQNIYVQHAEPDGDMLWGADGFAVCVYTGDQQYPVIVSDGDYGAIIAWKDSRVTDHDVYAQRINASGIAQWTYNGEPVCTTTGFQNQIQITTDDNNGAIIGWQDARLNSQFDLWAQRMDSNGDPVWRVDGVQVCLALPQDQTRPRIIPDTKGGIFVSWDDNRPDPYYDVYANRVERGGYYGYPAADITQIVDVPDDEGGWVDLTFAKSRLDEDGEPVVHYSIWRKLPDQMVNPLLTAGEKSAANWQFEKTAGGPVYFFEEVNGTTYGWEFIDVVPAMVQPTYTETVPTLYDMVFGDVDGTHYFRVIAHTDDDEIFWESRVDSGYSVDNTPPGQTSGFGGEQSANPPGLKLTWNSSTAPDFLYFKIYRGTNGIPGSPELDAETLLTTTTDTTYFDSEWRWDSDFYYKLTAVDTHDNEGDPVYLGDGEIVGVQLPDIPAYNHLDQNFPNPFNPVTTIRFGLRAPALVTLRIYDVSGRLVRELVDEKRVAGTYKETWDGKNTAGKDVASGVYFYRLRAGGFDQSKKMILTR
ncbi:MAG: T9SS type A sorting domain-containing protein [Candidatus Latescibacterota bacterium]|nr:MAG: T9SS type A sorting domain-containing protein [Candidatus Latescibacterota bacterium]